MPSPARLQLRPSLLRPPASCLLLGLSLLFAPAPAGAVDGRLGYEEQHQAGGSAGTDYTLQTITRDAFAQQLVPLWAGFSLRLEAQVRDEETQSEVAGNQAGWDLLTQRAGASLRYGGSMLRLNLNADGRRREQAFSPAPALTQDAGQLGGWANLRASHWLSLQGSWLETQAWREQTDGPEIETRESLRSAGVESDLAAAGTLRYGYTRNATENRWRHSLGINSSHLFAYEGGVGFLDGRGRLSLSARSRRFRQRVRVDSFSGRLLLEPLVVGVRIDASPELQDPLEEELTPIPALADLDRHSPTSVDLGDDAPVGLQLGGDYRNLQMDLGAPMAINAAVLYVDRRPRAPQLMDWRLYVAEDSEGRVWTEDAAASASTVYRDYDSGLQGWEFTLDPPLTARYVKLVNVKLGPVEPVLRVTELEFYTPDDRPGSESRDRSTSNRLDTALDYRLGAHLRARVDLSLRRRSYDGDRARLDESARGVGLNWGQGPWSASGRVELHRVESEDLRDSDVTSSFVGVRRTLAKRHSLGLHYDQVDDRGAGGDRRTRALSLSSNWLLAPALRFSQRLSYGWLDDLAQDLRSRSLTSQSTLHSVPFAWLFVDLSRTDRWVRRQAGIGFTRFNDTTLSLGWTPVPLVSLRSYLVYQVRERGEWLVRHTVTWTPLPGGDLALRLNASQFSDTRVDTRQSGAGAALTWEPRPRLVLEGGVDAQRYHRAGSASSPVNTFVKGSFAF